MSISENDSLDERKFHRRRVFFAGPVYIGAMALVLSMAYYIHLANEMVIYTSFNFEESLLYGAVIRWLFGLIIPLLIIRDWKTTFALVVISFVIGFASLLLFFTPLYL